MANLKLCSFTKTVRTFFLFLHLNWHTVPVLNTSWKPTESVCRDVPGSSYSNVTSMLWNREHLECDYMLLPQMNVSSRGNLLPNFIFTESESKPIKTSWWNHTGFDLVEIIHFLWSTEEISENKRSLSFSLCLSKDLQSVSVQTEPQNL